jgi:hypothetical protein
MGIECRFGTWRAEDDLSSTDESSVGFVPKLAICGEYELEKCSAELPVKRRSWNGHTNV